MKLGLLILQEKKILNIGTQSVQELFFLMIGSRSIRRTVYSNDLVKFFGGVAMYSKKETGNL